MNKAQWFHEFDALRISKTHWQCENPMNVSNESNIIFSPTQSTMQTQPRNFTIANLVCVIAEKLSKIRTDSRVIWKPSLQNFEQSLFDSVQVSSHMSRYSLNHISIKIYPLLLTLLKFTEAQSRDHLKSSRSIVACLPVKYQCNSSDDEKSEIFDAAGDSINTKLFWLYLLQSHFQFIPDCIKPLDDLALEGGFAEVLDN